MGSQFGTESRMLSFMVEERQKFEKIQKIEIRTKMDKRGDFSIKINFSTTFVLNASLKFCAKLTSQWS
jgi:hypothetical protein